LLPAGSPASSLVVGPLLLLYLLLLVRLASPPPRLVSVRLALRVAWLRPV
jgi:hypothetical protein